ncbi:MAG: acyl-CoA synthetase [Xanthomonadaceae bacterium]|nr:acyl-CoA synthetase [Xanthomonadaceae bacterium]
MALSADWNGPRRSATRSVERRSGPDRGLRNVSAVVEIRGVFPAGIALLADADTGRPIAWRDGEAVTARDFLAEAVALSAQLPSARYAINLCEDRYRFSVAFCAAAVAGQTNLLPGSRMPQTIAETRAAYPDSYVLAERVPQDPNARHFVLPGVLETDKATPMPSLPPEHIVAIAFTSGSTGAPKANPKTWGALCASSAFNAGAICAGAAPNIVATVPPQHMYGLELSVLLPLRSHAAIHSGHPFFPADIVHALVQIPAPRLLVTTPHHLRALLRSDAVLPALDAIVSATAPLPAELARTAEARYRTRVVEVFGSTETCVIAHRRTARGEPWSPYPGIALHPQPDGTLVDAPYFPAPTLLHDIVELLPDKRFCLCGRNGDLLEIAGKRASLGDLNRRLLAIPGVEDGAIFQLDADDRGVRRLAALAVAPNLDATQILDALRAAIDPVFLPRPLRLVAALPRNAAGKLPRAALLKGACEQATVQASRALHQNVE